MLTLSSSVESFSSRRRGPLLFTPGPLEVSRRVREACTRRAIFHRDSAFQDVLEGLQKRLLLALAVSDAYFPCFFTSTGHGANEAMIIPLLLYKTPLFITNGMWGDALIAIARRHRSEVLALECSRDKRLDPQEIDIYLSHHPEVDALVVVHQETRSGILNPISEIAAVAKNHNARLVVDAMSSVVIEETPFEDLGVSFFSCNSTKGLRSIPGIGIVCGQKEEFERLKDLRSDSYYFDLYAEYRSQYYGKRLRFAQSTTLFYALRESVDELLEEGVATRRALIQRRTREFREFAKAHRIKLAYRESELGHVTTAFVLSNDLSYLAFRDKLLKRGIYLLYGESEAGNQFQVCLVGALVDSDIHHLKQSLLEVLRGRI